MDALWLIPDRTVISESIVKYVIKEAFLRKVPVIGYNRFFMKPEPPWPLYSIIKNSGNSALKKP